MAYFKEYLWCLRQGICRDHRIYPGLLCPRHYQVRVVHKARQAAKCMNTRPDLFKVLESEKNRKLEAYKELLRLCLLQRQSMQAGDVSRVADVLMLKHEVIRTLGEIEACIVRIQRAITESYQTDDDEARFGSWSCEKRQDSGRFDREITAIMHEIMQLEDENRKELARHALLRDTSLRGHKQSN
ncbi:MAG: hypothetical protein HPY52_00585 [Firmicutes bacterium]|nr:hypothetical protein [Bacillota bacterium]